MKFIAVIATAAICCIALITCVAMHYGHDSILITGATSAIVGIVAGIGAYYKGKSKGTKDANKE